MAQLLFTFREAAIASFLLIPLFLILNRIRFHNAATTLYYTLFAVYLAGIYAVVGLPNITYVRFEINLNLIPVLTMLSDPRNTLLNIALFIPLGIFLPLLWKPFRSPWKCIGLGASMSLFIEILQMFTYRATDIDDLITNTAGTAVGWGLVFLFLKVRPAWRRSGRMSDLAIIFSAVFAVMFFLQPFLYNYLWSLFR